MGPFIPQLPKHTAALRDLLKKDRELQWTDNYEMAFKNLNNALKEQSALVYFNPNKKSVIQVDASSRVLRSILLQNGQPIAFASRSPTETEQRYANIAQEFLAVAFGYQRFHTYVYGRRFTVESDHKTLEMITRKNLMAAPLRLQRMLLEIQGYDMDIKYKPEDP